MAAYAVIARIGRVDPHLTIRDLDDDLDRDVPHDRQPGGPDRGLPVDLAPVLVDRFDDPTIGERVADQVAGVREAFGQMTFYLFDPESWRR
jgi:hypothetical protein